MFISESGERQRALGDRPVRGAYTARAMKKLLLLVLFIALAAVAAKKVRSV